MATIFQSPTKVAISARDQAIKAAKAAAKTSLETTKAIGQDVLKQTTGMEKGAVADETQQDNQANKQFEIEKMQDQEYRVKRYQELKAELEQTLLKAHQDRLQREQQRQQTQTQMMANPTDVNSSVVTQPTERKGPFGKMKRAVKSMYERATSKERKSGAGG